jgi:hypothetical protein
MDPKTGAILNPYDQDGVYAAFAGSPPVQELQPPDCVLAHGPQRPGTVYPRSQNPFSSMFEGLKGGLGSIFRR